MCPWRGAFSGFLAGGAEVGPFRAREAAAKADGLRLRRGDGPFSVGTGVPGKPGSFKTPILFFLERKKRMRLLMV